MHTHIKVSIKYYLLTHLGTVTSHRLRRDNVVVWDIYRLVYRLLTHTGDSGSSEDSGGHYLNTSRSRIVFNRVLI